MLGYLCGASVWHIVRQIPDFWYLSIIENSSGRTRSLAQSLVEPLVPLVEVAHLLDVSGVVRAWLVALRERSSQSAAYAGE